MLHVFSIHEYFVLPFYGGLFKVTKFRKTSLVFMFAKRIQIDTHYTLALTCMRLNKFQLFINRCQFHQPVFGEKQSYLPVIPKTRFTVPTAKVHGRDNKTNWIMFLKLFSKNYSLQLNCRRDLCETSEGNKKNKPLF